MKGRVTLKINLITYGVKAEDVNCASLCCCGDAFSHVHHHPMPQSQDFKKKVITSPLQICEMIYLNFSVAFLLTHVV